MPDQENKNNESLEAKVTKPLTFTNTSSGSDKHKFLDKLKIFWSKPKNRIITEIILGVIIITLVGIILYRWTQDQINSANNNEQSAKKETETIKYPNILDGTSVAESLVERHPLGVMVENHVDARPQSGVSSASIVYEAIAEGGITRYLCLFSSQDASKIGPIRSARTYFVDIAKEYNAYLAHVGGNYDALQQIIADKILDLDQFQNSGYYYRDNSRKVSSEHTMYSSTGKLYELAAKKGYTTTNSFAPLKFKDDSLVDNRPPSQKVSVDFGSSQYKVTYDYDQQNNVYLRSLAGQPDKDQANGQRITAKNIIIQEVSRTATTTVINEHGYNFQLIGSGKAKIIRDGVSNEGSWSKSSGTSRTVFSDSSGKEVELNAGQTWIEIVHPGLSVTIE